jgi:hypothetical protein
MTTTTKSEISEISKISPETAAEIKARFNAATEATAEMLAAREAQRMLSFPADMFNLGEDSLTEMIRQFTELGNSSRETMRAGIGLLIEQLIDEREKWF